MKKLPSIYKKTITKNINNNKNYCYLEKKDKQEDRILSNTSNNSIEDIEDTLKSIFKQTGYPYNINVLIKTNSKEYNTYLVSKTDYSITTIDNEVINLDEIISLTRI